MKVARNIGFLPVEHWTFTKQEDRDLPYHIYIEKLKSVPESEIDRLKKLAEPYKIRAYASVPTNRDAMANAIVESKAGILARFTLGDEWWTDKWGNTTWVREFIEPLRPHKVPMSGHAVTESNFDGGSFRVANTWSSEWADGGTAYHFLSQVRPTECWTMFFSEIPKEIEDQLATIETLQWKVLTLLQKLLSMLQRSKLNIK